MLQGINSSSKISLKKSAKLTNALLPHTACMLLGQCCHVIKWQYPM